MKQVYGLKVDVWRIRTGPFASSPGEPCGAFIMPGPCGVDLKIIAADAKDNVVKGWEHVSVSTEHRIPNWQEMSFVKDLFWYEDECVVQFHPPKAAYINYHPYCLHLWKFVKRDFPMPPTYLVGPKGKGK